VFDRFESLSLRLGARILDEGIELCGLLLALGSSFENLPAQLLQVAQDRIFIKRLRFLWFGVCHAIIERDEAAECKRTLSSRASCSLRP
jgi:hypothetical protein